mgnify:CR=1 FL=1|tara:strand:+ start:1164 stop:1307 length:144 start_codon:yes stop_codon:yes gene_type:complete
MRKKNIYKFKPKVSKARKDASIYIQSQGRIKTFSEFKKIIEEKNNGS